MDVFGMVFLEICIQLVKNNSETSLLIGRDVALFAMLERLKAIALSRNVLLC